MNPPNIYDYYACKNVRWVGQSSTRPVSAGRRICITGGRDFTDLTFVWSHLDDYLKTPFGPIVEIGFGCARGVDELGWKWAAYRDIPWRRYFADWDRFGDVAGTLRNGAMLDDFQPDVLLVFPGGSGTRNCALQAKDREIERDFMILDPLEEAQRWG